MGTVREEFLLKFSNLEGVTIAERRKNFFRLMHQVAPLLKDSPEDLDFVSTNLTTNSFLEDLFKVDFFIYFRRTSELLQILKDGNSVFVSKVAKQSWFFQQAFNDVPADRFVNEILPCMSYSVRMKVLRKLSRYASCEDFEKIYDALVERYGIYLASQFVTGCGPDRVRKILIECPNIRLTSTQLRILYDKDPELVDFYFVHSKYSIRDRQYGSLIKFIYHKDRNYFDYLKQKYEIFIKLGRRASKKFVAGNKDAVIKRPHMFDYLNMKAVTRKIGKDSVKLFINTLPSQVGTTLHGLDKYNCFAKKYLYSLLFKTYQSHYNIKFEDYPHLIDEHLLKIVPDSSERANLAKVKVNEGCDEYIKYLAIDESVALIKEKINLTSDVQERSKLITDLVETCHINNDLNALFSVLKYFCVQHKNDEWSVHALLIQNIENLFGFKKFTDEMWTCLNELLAIRALKFDKNDATCKKNQIRPFLLKYGWGCSAHQIFSYLEFLFKKGEPIDELIREYFQAEHLQYYNRCQEYPRYGNYGKSFERYFLFFIINNIARQSDQQEDLSFNVNLMSEIDKWNKCYKDDQLSFYDFPTLLHTLNHVVRDNGYYRQQYNMYKDASCIVNAFRSKIFTTEPNSYRNEHLQVYWQRSYIFMFSLKDIKWFLKYDPLVVVENFETVFFKLIEDFYMNIQKISRKLINYCWYIIKKCRHLQLDEAFVDKCLAKLMVKTECRTQYLHCLSILMKPNDYAALANSYKLEDEALALTTISKKLDLDHLLCTIAAEFKNTKSHEVLPTLLNLCAGDCFEHAMPSLYSLLYRTPENMLPQYFKFLSNKAERKHALHMISELSSLSEVQKELQLLNDQEGSLQKHIQYFVKNPTDSLFELVKMNTRADHESLSCVVDHLVEVPQKYKASYIVHAWGYLEKTAELGLASLKDGLLSGLNEETVKEFSLDWGLRIIQQHFMTENGQHLNLNDFMFTFIGCKDEKGVIFETIFAFLDQCKDQALVWYFLNDWYSKIMSSDRADLKHLHPFVNYFEKKITPVKNFDGYVKVFFLKTKIERSFSLPVDDLAVRVLGFFEQVNASYGPHATRAFAEEMDSNLSHFEAKKSVTKVDIYYSMIKQRPVPLVAGLLLHVIAEPLGIDDVACMQTFLKILRLIKGVDDVGIQITLHHRFNKYLTIIN